MGVTVLPQQLPVRSWVAFDAGMETRKGLRYFYVWVEDGELVKIKDYASYALTDDEANTVAGVLGGTDELDVWNYVHNSKEKKE